MRKTDFEKPHIKQLNREIEFERKGKLIFKTVCTLIITIMVIGPTVLLLVLNADWIDAMFSKWWIQFAFFVFSLAIILYLWIKWRIKR